FAGSKRIAQFASGSSSPQYYWSDQLGSSRVMTDASANSLGEEIYAPFGQAVSGALPTHYRFTGKERDSESNLDYFGARYYASSMGRWMSPDWAAKPTEVPYADFGDPESLNLYGYVRNNPLSHRDADGHECPECMA